MRFFLLVLWLTMGTICTSFAQSAQKNSAFNFGLETSFPFAKQTINFKTGVGASLKYEYRADSNFYLSISVGYISYGLTDSAKAAFVRSEGIQKSSLGFLPIKIGGKFYIHGGFFGEVQLGNTFETNSYKNYLTPSSVAFSPGIGYVFDSGLEFGARYEGWLVSGVFSQFDLRLGYRFK